MSTFPRPLLLNRPFRQKDQPGKIRTMQRKQRHMRTMLFIILGLFCTAIMVFPWYWVIISSLKSTTELFSAQPTFFPQNIDLSPYIVSIVGNPQVLQYMSNSLQIALGSMGLGLALGAPMAYALARFPIRAKNVLLLLLLVVQMFPGIMLATPLFLIFSQIGLIDTLLAVILAITTHTLPFAVLILRLFFLHLPSELEDAAAIDGCSLWGCFWRIVLPLSRPGLLTTATLTFLMGWSNFLFPLTFIATDTNRPLTVGIYELITQFASHWNDLMAVSTIASLPLIFVFVFAQKYITAGLTTGAVKE